MPEDVSWLVDQLHEEQPENMTHDDANVVYYVAGCIGRSVSRLRKCFECKTCLTETAFDPTSESGSDNSTRSRLLHLANRGGLAAPSEYTMSVCIFGFLYFKQIFDTPDLARQMFQRKTHADIFTSAVLYFLQKDSSLRVLTAFTCMNGHICFELIMRKLFNCLSKNILARLNTTPHITPASDLRKLRKLQSCQNPK